MNKNMESDRYREVIALKRCYNDHYKQAMLVIENWTLHWREYILGHTQVGFASGLV